MQIVTVSILTEHIKDLLEGDEALSDLWVEGEISNFTQSSAGHCYFTLKDDGSQLRCVLWRSQAALLRPLPTNGEAILAHGNVSIYPAQGAYQLYVDRVQRMGSSGMLFLQLEALKARLEGEGLFAHEHKRPLPSFPRCIGVVTSPTGAVLQDILKVLKRRYPIAQVIVAPTLVQGLNAPPQIVAAIQALNRLKDVDVMIVGRGGGSIEELWAFNDERVARAIYASRIPVISGVGHETDFTIADFVADLRAPTPSAAAELAVPERQELLETIAQQRSSICQAMQRCIGEKRADALHRHSSLQHASPRSILDRQRQTLDVRRSRLTGSQAYRLALYREQLAGIISRLQALDPRATLQRGYAIVSGHDTRSIVTSTSHVTAGERLDVQVRDGRFTTTVDRENEEWTRS